MQSVQAPSRVFGSAVFDEILGNSSEKSMYHTSVIQTFGLLSKLSPTMRLRDNGPTDDKTASKTIKNLLPLMTLSLKQGQ